MEVKQEHNTTQQQEHNDKNTTATKISNKWETLDIERLNTKIWGDTGQELKLNYNHADKQKLDCKIKRK